MDLLLLVTVRVVLHLLAGREKKKSSHCGTRRLMSVSLSLRRRAARTAGGAHRQLEGQLKLLVLEQLADLAGDGDGHQAPHKVVAGHVDHVGPAGGAEQRGEEIPTDPGWTRHWVGGGGCEGRD